MKVEAVGYVRVSSKEQEREGFSIPAQKKLLQEYARENNIKLVRIFEEAETAKQAGRKQFRKMLDFLDDNPEIKDILAEKVDRMYRNFSDLVALGMDTKRLKLHFVKQGKILSKDSKSQEKLHHDIDLAVSKYYVNNLSEEVIKGSDEKAAQGGWPGPAPLGYKNRLEDHTIILHPEESILIKKLFELASTGQYTLSSLAEETFKIGLRSKRAKNKLVKSAVQRILTSPFYYGYFLRKGKLHKAAHEPVISKQLFDLVQDRLNNKRKPSLTKHQLTYRGTMTCAHCGCAITAQKKKGRYIYYHCTNGKRRCDNITYIREEDIDNEIKSALQKISIPPSIIEWTHNKLLETSKEELESREAQLSVLTKRYKDLDARISQAYDHFLDGKIEADTWESKSNQWKAEKLEIQQKLDTIELDNSSRIRDGMRLMERASSAHALFDHMTSDERRQIAHLVLSNSTIKNGSLQYDYKKPFSIFVGVTNLEDWRGGPRSLLNT